MMPSTQVEVKDRLPLSCLLSRFDDAREVSQNKTIVQSSLLRACPSPSLSSILPVIIKKKTHETCSYKNEILLYLRN